MAVIDQTIFLFAVLVTVTGLDWAPLFNNGQFESVQCTIKHTYKLPKPRDFTFRLHCIEGIATVTYDTHMLNTVQVESCNPDYIKDHILVQTQQQDDEPPNETTLYIVKGNACKYNKYSINNALGNVDAAVTKQTGACATVRISDLATQEPKQSFTDCTPASTKLTKNVIDTKTEDEPRIWFSPTKTVLPKSSNAEKYKNLLSCSFETETRKLDLLCYKIDGLRRDYRTGEYHQAYAAFITRKYSATFEGKYVRVNVKSCWESDIVGSIFPLKDRPPTDDRIYHPTFRYSFSEGDRCSEQKCKISYQRMEECWYMNRNLDPINCPSKDDSKAWFHPSTGVVGVWGKCTGLYSTSMWDPKL